MNDRNLPSAGSLWEGAKNLLSSGVKLAVENKDSILAAGKVLAGALAA